MLKQIMAIVLIVTPWSIGGAYASCTAAPAPESAVQSGAHNSTKAIVPDQNDAGLSPGISHSDGGADSANRAMERLGTTTHTIDFRGTVQAVDRENRLMALQLADGDHVLVRVGDSVRNFEELNLGDSVTVHYAQAAVLSVARGARPKSHAREAQASKASATHASFQSHSLPQDPSQTVMIGRLSSVDQASGDIIVYTKDGHSIDMQAPREALVGASEGDAVFITYMEPAAMSVEPAEGSSLNSAAARTIA